MLAAPELILPGILLALSLAIVAQGMAPRGIGSLVRARLTVVTCGGTIVLAAALLFVTFAIPALIGLALLDGWRSVVVMPIALRPAAWAFGASGLPEPEALVMIAPSLAIGVLIGLGILLVRLRLGRGPIGLRYRSSAAIRSAGEWGPAALLSLSAGVSEELFFRLWLPLVVALVGGSAGLGFAVGVIAFALAHWQQGRVIVVVTTGVGTGLAYLYLITGMLWVAILLHVLIDLHSLIVRPLISGRFRARGQAIPTTPA